MALKNCRSIIMGQHIKRFLNVQITLASINSGSEGAQTAGNEMSAPYEGGSN